MSGGSKPPVTPVLEDPIPSSVLWLSAAQALTIHMAIHIIKKITKFILKPPMKRNLKTKTINDQMGLRKKFQRSSLAFGGFLGVDKQRGWRLSSGCSASRLPVSLCSVCFL